MSINFDNLEEDTIDDYIRTFSSRRILKNSLGGCPSEEYRVKEKTECFYCDECWIAALKNIRKQRAGLNNAKDSLKGLLLWIENENTSIRRESEYHRALRFISNYLEKIK